MPDALPRLEVGQRAPLFTRPDQDGEDVKLIDFRGRKVILFFYPAANTPACTTQACDLRDHRGFLQAQGYAVLGISKDRVEDLARFRDEQHLSYPLLSDPDLRVHRRYGAWGEKSLYGKLVTGTLRSTFVIDEKGVLTQALYNVKATGHLSMLAKRLKLPI
jgi:peroxiredoxin Q/BCP